MRLSNCSAPIPPGTSLFYCCPGLPITFFTLPARINHSNPFHFSVLRPLFHSIFQCSALFITHIFLLTPGMGLEQFDHHIMQLRKSSLLFLNFFTCGDEEVFLGAANLLEEAEIQ